MSYDDSRLLQYKELMQIRRGLSLESSLSDQQESQIINQRCRQILLHKDAQSQQHIPQAIFTPQQRQNIAKRFTQLSPDDQRMDYAQFRRGLGLLGRQDSFICRIFNLVDDDTDGWITLQNYEHYLGVILRGSQLEKARFGWLILTEGHGDIDFKDFMDLFQEISVVWNALTGQIITPKRKYIEELFHTFDVDQDQSITFQDFRLFFDEHLTLFGWFEYFNGLEIDQEESRAELEKVREKLRLKLRLQPNQRVSGQNREQLKLMIHDSEVQIERKLTLLSSQLYDTGDYIRKRNGIVRDSEVNQFSQISPPNPSLTSTNPHSLYSSTNTHKEEEPSIRSLYKYSHEQSIRSLPNVSLLNKIHRRKEQINRENRNSFGQEVISELKTFLERTEGVMKLCQQYREHEGRLRKFSPTKLKQMQVKLSLFDKQGQLKKEAKTKEKMTVYFGHENWNLVLNIMVGLRKSIKSLNELNHLLEIKEDHFTERHQFFLGNKSFLSGKGPQALKNMESFLFIETAPVIFERLRQRWGLSNHDYQRSVGPQSLLNQLLTGDLTALNEKCSTGKSGAFFYLTSDNRVFLKTITKNEFNFFAKIVRGYYEHMTAHSNTLIVRVFGLYKLKVFLNKQKIKTMYFISMENIFGQITKESGLKIEETYDLKGSLYDRFGKQGKELKDQDWIDKGRKIRLEGELGPLFKEQIKADSKFFKRNNINDYSLMVAIVSHKGGLEVNQEVNSFKRIRGGVISRQPGKMYVLSIIDFLTAFEAIKNLQYIFKTTFLSNDVSCIPPTQYSHRFRDFIISSVE